MQEDKLRDFLKFFRFNLPWFVVFAGFFAVILFAGLFISSKLNKNSEVADITSPEKLELSVPEPIDALPEITQVPSSPSAITIPSPSSIATALPIPSITPIPDITKESEVVAPSMPPTPSDEKKSPENSSYVVRAGDSLWSIAERIYGSGFEYKRIKQENNIDNHFKLLIGQTLVIPATPAMGQIASGVSIDHGDDSVAVNGTEQSSQQKNYTVIKGDSLWQIADQQLGDAYRWTEIYELNKNEIGHNPNLIYPDAKLTLPENMEAQPDKNETESSSSTNQSSNWTSSLLQ